MIDTAGLECLNDRGRRSDLLAGSTLNGIDYLDVMSADHRTLRVHWLKPPTPVPAADQVKVLGGTRVSGIAVTGVTPAPGSPDAIDVRVDRLGDHSRYVLDVTAAPNVDARLGRIAFSFMQGCAVDADCPHEPPCPPRQGSEPALDYLAKDYASFRQLMLDLLPLRNPAFTEINVADLGMALIETMAYAGDRLSYYQDAIAGEAYLETARHRASVRRHARLIDYPMHDGRNAWTFIQLTVETQGRLPQGTRLLTRVAAPLAGRDRPPGLFIDPALVSPATLTGDPALSQAVVFETAHPQDVHWQNNELRIHAFGDDECNLAPGTTEACLYVAQGSSATRPMLSPGDYLLLEEVLGPSPLPRPEEANRAHRQVVRIINVKETGDALYSPRLVQGVPQRRTGADDHLPLVQVTWGANDGLSFPLCLSVRRADGGLQAGISVARGNIVLADHGLTVQEDVAVPDSGTLIELSQAPVTIQCPADPASRPAYLNQREVTPRVTLDGVVEAAQPSVLLFPPGAQLPWTPRPDLLESSPYDTHFVIEVDDRGAGSIRFGDGEYGRQVDPGEQFTAVYRVGNGREGNIGADTIAHVLLGSDPGFGLRAVRNPLPGRDGTDPEAIAVVRQRAPRAFSAQLFRAVTEDDYAQAARSLPGVADATASFRWTGSWRSVVVAVKPADPASLETQPDGRIRLRESFLRSCRDGLETFRLAGYDLDVRAPQFVPLRVAVQVCPAPGYFRQDVSRAVATALSTRDLPGGRRGLFHPANLSFGDPVYLSRLIAAAAQVEGVSSVVATEFRRLYDAASQSLSTGVIQIAPWEIARLDSDPDFPDHGVLLITAIGGKG